MHSITAIIDSNASRQPRESEQSYVRRLLKFAQKVWHNDTFEIAKNVVGTKRDNFRVGSEAYDACNDIIIELADHCDMQRELLGLDE
jgi:hypothetical protein